jgi:hypothetical protein
LVDHSDHGPPRLSPELLGFVDDEMSFVDAFKWMLSGRVIGTSGRWYGLWKGKVFISQGKSTTASTTTWNMVLDRHWEVLDELTKDYFKYEIKESEREWSSW